MRPKGEVASATAVTAGKLDRQGAGSQVDSGHADGEATGCTATTKTLEGKEIGPTIDVVVSSCRREIPRQRTEKRGLKKLQQRRKGENYKIEGVDLGL